MGIGAVVHIEREGIENIDILRKRHPGAHRIGEKLIVHGGIAGLLRKEIVLIRHNAIVNVRARTGKIRFIYGGKPLRRVPDEIGIHRIIELCEMPAGCIYAVIIELPQDIPGEKCLERAEAVPQRELVERILFKGGHIRPVRHRRGAQRRALGELSPLGERVGPVRRQDRREQKARKKESRERKRENISDLLHAAPPQNRK